MLFASVKKNMSEIRHEFSRFFTNSYPEFVTRRSPVELRNEIPIFVFHSIQPEIFKSQIEYLYNNNYETIGADEFYSCIKGDIPIPPKTVLLAVDDGRKSFFEYGFPILQKYGYKAVVFIIPGYTPDSAEKKDYAFSGEELLTWGDIDVMHKSGLVDFQSHTLYHHKVFTGNEVIDFLGEDSIQPIYDQILPFGFENEIARNSIKQYYGLPIYQSSSLMEGKPLYMDDNELRNAYIQFYADNIEANGNSQNWKRKMMKFLKKYKNKRGYYLTNEETKKVILENLTISRKMIEDRLQKQIRHLCYPNSLYSELSTQLSKEAGYVTNFCGCISGGKSNKKGSNPYRCVRLKNDFIFRLLGKGRKTLKEIIMFKIKRRMSGMAVY